MKITVNSIESIVPILSNCGGQGKALTISLSLSEYQAKNILYTLWETYDDDILCKWFAENGYVLTKKEDGYPQAKEIVPVAVVPTEEMRRVLDLCVQWYNIPGNECGGALHAVLDDDNVDDHHISYSREQAIGTIDMDAIAILEGLGKLTLMQRKWVTYNIYGVKDGEGEIDVHEEDEDGNIIGY